MSTRKKGSSLRLIDDFQGPRECARGYGVVEVEALEKQPVCGKKLASCQSILVSQQSPSSYHGTMVRERIDRSKA